MIPQPDRPHHYMHVNGVRFHYVRMGQGEKLVLLLHGFPEFWYGWRNQLEALSQQFTVVAPDLRGYNLSDKPTWGYETDVLVQDVVGMIDALGFKQAMVVGHDWGGIVAWNVAINAPHRVERLVVLNAPHPQVFLEDIRTNREQMRRSWYMGYFLLPWLPEASIRANDYSTLTYMFRGSATNKEAFSDRDIQAYKTAMAQPGALTAALNYYRAAGRNPTRSSKLVNNGTVKAPTLLIWGEQDIALGTELSVGNERFAPDLRVHRIPNASHWVQHDAPEEVNRVLLDFLSEQSAPDADRSLVLPAL